MASATHVISYDRHWIVLTTTRVIRGEPREFPCKFLRDDLRAVVPLLEAELTRPPRPEEVRRTARPPDRTAPGR